MSVRPEDNFPEVVPDSSPQVVSQEEFYQRSGYAGGEGKYPWTPSDEGKHYLAPGDAIGSYKEAVTPSIASPAPAPATLASDAAPPPAEARICGVKRKIFWIVLGVAIVVVIAVAVGAGVGASRGGSSTPQDESVGAGAASTSSTSPASSSSSSSTPPPSSSSEPSSTVPSASLSSTPSASSSAASATPTFLNNMTAPATEGDFAFQGFASPNYTGNATEIYSQTGFIDFPFDLISYVWLPNNTECCITFCRGTENKTGYWCDPRYQEEASGFFDRLMIGCGNEAHPDRARCE